MKCRFRIIEILCLLGYLSIALPTQAQSQTRFRLQGTIKDAKTNEAPEQVPPVKGAEKNLPVPVTAKVKTQLALEAASATTALAKTDPVRAQQMATQVATTKGIANKLQVVGLIANQAKGNNTQLALTQHRQQETAIVLASQKGKTK